MIQLTHTESPGEGTWAILCSKDSNINAYTHITDLVYASRKASASENKVYTLPNAEGATFLVVANKLEGLSGSERLEDLRRLGGSLSAQAEAEKVSHLQLVADDPQDKEAVLALVEGILLASYRYQQFKSKKTALSLETISVIGDLLSQDDLDELGHVAAGTWFARDLVNEPVISLNATAFAQKMAAKAEEAGCTSEILDKSKIEALRMGGLLGVNAGSIDPPSFTVLTWKPENASQEKPIILVGKGVVYDTGGNNLKSGGYMSTMKSDMGGGAAVAGAMCAIASNKVPAYVIGLVPAADNRIGKNALVADDVITISDGTTVEVQNTDAEGRLILADALVYAQKYDPQLVVDMATLTGAADRITGSYGIARLSKASEEVREALDACGEAVYERCIELPAWREFNDLLKSEIADVKNIGGPTGGATTAGKFLERFTKYPWIHLDIAGPSFLQRAESYKPAGGTGVGVRLMYAFVKHLATSKA